LSGLQFSFLVITHDRQFLQSVCNRVIELNKRYKDGYFSSAGNYSDFIESREKLFEAQAQLEETTRNIVRREVEWLRKGPKARTTKQKARIDRAGELIQELGELSYRNAQDKTANINFSDSARQSKKLIELIGVEKSLGGRKLFGPLDLLLSPGDKLGLLGGNGSGKSTLLRVLINQLQPDKGTVKRGDQLKIVVFDQHREQLNMSWPLRKALCENGDRVQYKGSTIHVAGWADRFLFSKQQLDMPLSRLSGGEQSRVLIARLMLRQADVLLLDEPTNDLDMNTLDVLETSLMDFPGALVLDRVSNNLLSLDGKGNARFYADLSQWQDSQTDAPSTPADAPIETPPEPKPKQTGLTKKEAKELKEVEASIQEAERAMAEARGLLQDPSIASNGIELIARQKTVDAWQQKLDALTARWEQLEALRG
jgi:ATP-binding cassette subfamily F protein uup